MLFIIINRFVNIIIFVFQTNSLSLFFIIFFQTFSSLNELKTLFFLPKVKKKGEKRKYRWKMLIYLVRFFFTKIRKH